MAEEADIPVMIPGMVAVEFIGESDAGERKGSVKNVFPIDARDLVATGNYKLYENGAVEAARLNPVPLRAKPAKVTEEAKAPAPAAKVEPAPAAPASAPTPVKK